MRVQSEFKGFWTFHVLQHFFSSSDLLSPHILQALASRAHGCHHGPAGSAPCPTRPSQSTALTCRPWFATRPTLSSPCSTTPAPAPPPVAPTVTSLLEPSGNFPASAMIFSQVFSNWTWTLKIFDRKSVMLTESMKVQLRGADLITEKSLHSTRLWSLHFN